MHIEIRISFCKIIIAKCFFGILCHSYRLDPSNQASQQFLKKGDLFFRSPSLSLSLNTKIVSKKFNFRRVKTCPEKLKVQIKFQKGQKNLLKGKCKFLIYISIFLSSFLHYLSRYCNPQAYGLGLANWQAQQCKAGDKKIEK